MLIHNSLAKSLSLVGMLGLLNGTAACDPSWYDPRVFDDLIDDTWVDTGEAPGSLGNTAYGVGIAGGGQGAFGASFLVAAQSNDGLGHVTFDSDGTPTVNSIDLLTINTLDQPNGWPAPPAMAGAPDSPMVAVAMSNGGGLDEPTQATVALMDSGNGNTLGLASLPGSDLIHRMAFGLTNVAGSNANNIAVLRFDQLAVIPDTNDPQAVVPSCNHEMLLPLSVMVAEIDSGSTGKEIIFAGSNGTDPSVVQIVTGSLVSDAAATVQAPEVAPCFAPGRMARATIDAPNGERDFGAGMVVGDFNGNNMDDLAIGATETGNVYVYLDVNLNDGPLPTPVIIDGPPTAIGFGEILAAGDVRPDLRDELIVGLPDNTVGSKSGAGAVFVYDYGDAGFSPPLSFSDAQTETDARFGRAIAVVPFGMAREILVVGTSTEVFTYFRLHPDDDDVRAASAQ